MVITSERLELVPMTPRFIEHLLAGESALAAEEAGLSAPPQWEGGLAGLELRLTQLNADPALQQWLIRAVVLRDSRIMIGHIGFHAAPDHKSLLELGLTGLEFGYTIFPPHRRKGFAKEAAAALMGWAQAKHGIDSFVVSISPENAPSLAVAQSLGFRKVASHIDPVDGLEDIFNVILDRKS